MPHTTRAKKERPRIRTPRQDNPEPRADGTTATPTPMTDHLVLEAGREITIRCGESSITLTAAGKIILRGKYIVSRSSGVQRIKGGSVQIN